MCECEYNFSYNFIHTYFIQPLLCLWCKTCSNYLLCRLGSTCLSASLALNNLFSSSTFHCGGPASKGAVSIDNQWVGQWSHINAEPSLPFALSPKCPEAASLVVDS